MKKIIISSLFIFTITSTAYADYSNNPHCRGFGILQLEERQKCVEANGIVNGKIVDNQGKLNIKNFRAKTGKFLNKMNVNTDSKLFKTGKYSEKK
ncbi:hypothetical protein OAL84_00325 [Pelagibacteraceae bacterium]|nr:hypothetical protein [Pelagibacteraceae bacterium]MDC0938051.1 hypothetical protein [Pelagibacteraceae bacterium]